MTTASVVLYHTAPSDLTRLIECVLKSNIDTFYVVDNSANDSLRVYTEGQERIKYIKSENLGFGHGHNIAIKEADKARSDFHAIINPDTYWVDPVLDSLTTYMQNNPQCGLLMPKVLYPNGDVQHLCKLLPSPANLFFRRFIPIEKYQKKHDRRYELQCTGYETEMEVPSLSGCFMFVRMDVIRQIGMFDERYFMYAEDLDLCRRIGEVSKTIYYPKVAIYHEYEKGSYKNKKLLKYHINSIVKYFNKWGWFFDSQRTKTNRECLQRIKREQGGR